MYLVVCPCGLPYVGSSMHTVKMCILEHKSRIKNRIIEAPLVSHYISMHHSPEDMKFCTLYKYNSYPYNWVDVHKLLLQKESF